MSDYTKLTNFTAKDTLPDSDPNKIVLGEEIDIEYTNIETAVASKANKVSGGTSGNLVARDVNGDITDSGITPTNAENSWQEVYSLSTPFPLGSAWQEDVFTSTYRYYMIHGVIVQTSGSTFLMRNTIGGTPDGSNVYDYASSVYAFSATPGPTVTGSSTASDFFNSATLGTSTTQVYFSIRVIRHPTLEDSLHYSCDTQIVGASEVRHGQYGGSSGDVDGFQIQGDANCTINKLVVLGLRNA